MRKLSQSLVSRLPVTIVLGLLVVLVAFGLGVRKDLQLAEERFAATTGEAAALVTRRLDHLNASLRSLSGMHHAMTRLSRQELSAFAQEIERTHPYVKTILQLRLVENLERENYVEEAREAGYPGFALTTLVDGNRLKPVPWRESYMALNFIEPLDPALVRFLGLDFFSDPLVNQASISSSAIVPSKY